MSLAKRLSRYDEEAKRAEKASPPSPPKPKCKCEDNELWKDLVSEIYATPRIQRQAKCICDFLSDYADFATETRKSDADVESLYQKARQLAYAGIGTLKKRLDYFEETIGLRMDSGTGPEFKSHVTEDTREWVADHLIETEVPALTKLAELIKKDSSQYGFKFDEEGQLVRNAKPERLDKVIFIESIIDLSHRSGPFLPNLCDYKMNGEVSMGDDFMGIVQNILDCLLKSKTKHPDMVAERMLNR